ncbi:TIGR02300 family protein [Algihabitans albus]|uniref:TIGR02300 family protein n=1 Tax=Algihabitans albus TaxID=2164067 RepID=UPI0013C33BFE|nr:TIGR02300 family protein [Algihabitans albus]
MSKPEWGVKRICQACGAKFYDFQRSPVDCPSCGTQFDPEAFLKSRRGKPAREKEPPKKKAPEPVEEEEEDEVVAADDEDDLVVEADEDESDEDLGDVAVEKEKE